MRRLGILDRQQDEGLHIRLRATHQTTHIGGGRLRLGRRAGQPAGRPKAVGVHLPRVTPASPAGVGIVKAKFVSAARAGGLSRYLEKDVPEQVSNYIGRDGAEHEGHKAELFNAHGPVSEEQRQQFVARAQRDPRLWHVIVSPQQADKLDMPLVVNRFMEQVQADTCRGARTSSVLPENGADCCARLVRMGQGAYLRTMASCLRTSPAAHA
jgi:hypothetical protein